MPSKQQSRRSVSVRGATYNHLRFVCAEQIKPAVSMSDFLEAAIVDRLAKLGMQPVPVVGARGIAGFRIPKPAPRPLSSVARVRAEALGVVLPAVREPAAETRAAAATNVSLAAAAPALPPITPAVQHAPSPERPRVEAPTAPPPSSARWMSVKEIRAELRLKEGPIRSALQELMKRDRLLFNGERYRATDAAILDVRADVFRPIGPANRILCLLAEPASPISPPESKRVAPAPKPAPLSPTFVIPPREVRRLDIRDGGEAAPASPRMPSPPPSAPPPRAAVPPVRAAVASEPAAPIVAPEAAAPAQAPDVMKLARAAPVPFAAGEARATAKMVQPTIEEMRRSRVVVMF